VSFRVPSALVPRAGARAVGSLRLVVAGGETVTLPVTLARTTAASGPAVRYEGGRLTITGLPANAAIADLTLRRAKAPRKRFRVQAAVTRDGAVPATLSVRPRAPRR
jgi:hypothetical protein